MARKTGRKRSTRKKSASENVSPRKGRPYQETQYPYPIIWVLLVAIVGYSLITILKGAALWPAALPVLICLAVALFFMPLRIQVEQETLRIAFGLAPLFVWRFNLQDIVSAEVVRYTPMRTYMGWGIRRGFDRSRALTIRGNRGVMLEMQDGKRYLVGSQHADELAAALNG